ncbi:MAG TPA: branched-chain amino acid ABC transporter permease [Thermoflexia bacterium]|nr:MAG: branched-chain amino acid ABC transporter permease [Chloroflexota bacterium]HEY68216.1 branched-chain amino acid ABC transporter permease [Thermoflexia bacterium]
MNLVLNGLLIGSIYALMALGLTLIFSVLGIVSFAHGEHYMIGGYVVYFLLETFTNLHPLLAILAAGLVTFLIGVLFERLFLQPMARGEIERPGEYAILVTFGLAFFLQYLVQGIVGPHSKRADRFFDLPSVDLGWLTSTAGTLKVGGIPFSASRLAAAAIAVILLLAMIYFIKRTWVGKGLQAVSQDRNAAAVVGINPLNMNTLAFGLGTMLAGMSGATLVDVFAWVPWIGVPASSKAFVIIVLGGMGSMPGALLGGLIIGVVESLGSGLLPDPGKALAYKDAFGLLIFALVLLVKPTGLFGRKL